MVPDGVTCYAHPFQVQELEGYLDGEDTEEALLTPWSIPVREGAKIMMYSTDGVGVECCHDTLRRHFNLIDAYCEIFPDTDYVTLNYSSLMIKGLLDVLYLNDSAPLTDYIDLIEELHPKSSLFYLNFNLAGMSADKLHEIASGLTVNEREGILQMYANESPLPLPLEGQESGILAAIMLRRGSIYALKEFFSAHPSFLACSLAIIWARSCLHPNVDPYVNEDLDSYSDGTSACYQSLLNLVMMEDFDDYEGELTIVPSTGYMIDSITRTHRVEPLIAMRLNYILDYFNLWMLHTLCRTNLPWNQCSRLLAILGVRASIFNNEKLEVTAPYGIDPVVARLRLRDPKLRYRREVVYNIRQCALTSSVVLDEEQVNQALGIE